MNIIMRFVTETIYSFMCREGVPKLAKRIKKKKLLLHTIIVTIISYQSLSNKDILLHGYYSLFKFFFVVIAIIYFGFQYT